MFSTVLLMVNSPTRLRRCVPILCSLWIILAAVGPVADQTVVKEKKKSDWDVLVAQRWWLPEPRSTIRFLCDNPCIRQCEIMPSAFLRVVRSAPVVELLQSSHKMSHILHSYSWHLTMRTVMFVFVFTTALYALIPIYAECAEFFCSGLLFVHRLYHCHCFGVGLIFFAHTHRHHCHVGDTLLDIWTRRDTFACLHENRWTCTQWMNVWMKWVSVCPVPVSV